MRTQRRYIRRRMRTRYVVLATCPTCKAQAEVATFSDVRHAREWVKVRGTVGGRRLTIIREV